MVLLTLVVTNINVVIKTNGNPTISLSDLRIAMADDEGEPFIPKCLVLGFSFYDKRPVQWARWCDASGHTEYYTTCEEQGNGCQEIRFYSFY